MALLIHKGALQTTVCKAPPVCRLFLVLQCGHTSPFKGKIQLGHPFTVKYLQYARFVLWVLLLKFLNFLHLCENPK